MNLEQILTNIYPLPPASLQKLEACITEVYYPRGYILLHADKMEHKIFFIKKGIARGYAYQEDSEVTFWFGKEGDAIVSMKSYVAKQKGYEDIELLEDCELYMLHADSLQTLYMEDIAIANWGRKFAERELIKTEERLIGLQFKTATERYKTLLEESPDLIQRVQLGYIASYLGITQVSLSRIRAEIR